MSEKREINLSELSNTTFARILRRLASWSLLKTGALERQFKQSISPENPSWRIIRYQHIVDPEHYPLPLSRYTYVRPKTFEQHLRFLFDHANVIDLETFLQNFAAETRLPEKTVVLTFDGGWVDNFHNALPALLKLQLPATFFLPTGFVGTNDLCWEDRVLQSMILLQGQKVPFPNFDFLSAGQLTLLRRISPGDKITFASISFIVEALRELSLERRQKIILLLAKAVNDFGGYPVLNLYMNWDQVRTICSCNGLKVGASTHTGLSLLDLTEEDLGKEIEKVIATFGREEIKFVEPLALPKGGFDDLALLSLRQLGVHLALSAYPFPRVGTGKEMPIVLGRVNMIQDMTYARDLFACHLWDGHLFNFYF